MTPRRSLWILVLAGLVVLLCGNPPHASGVGPPTQQWPPQGEVIGDPPSGGGGGDGGDPDEVAICLAPDEPVVLVGSNPRTEVKPERSGRLGPWLQVQLTLLFRGLLR